ncbi:MAG: acetylxylan esterase, partial [Pseudomonadota bacterium]
PRTNLPPDADDPARPPHTRLVKPGSIYWTDDIGIDDHGNPYNQYKRSSLGTWSNFDEAKADPFPLPDPLVLRNGERVTDSRAWWKRRRPEILEDFCARIYGRVPEHIPAITWKVTVASDAGGVRTKNIVGQIDNSAWPAATPVINLTLILPAGVSGRMPVLVVIPSRGGATGGAPPPPSSAAETAGPSPLQQVLARGWGYASFQAVSLQPDSNADLTSGIIGLLNRGQPRRRPDDWGALTAWAWGLSRCVDYLETDPDVDAKRLGVEGHSRWGKTALWAAALDQRWAIVFASCSGEGGAKLHRRNFGETVDNIIDFFPYWMADGFRRYGGHWNDLPVDAHELIALIAPRPVFVTGGTQDTNADPHGEFLAMVGAGPVYRLLGRTDLGTSQMPAPDVALTSGDLAFREHAGAHTDLLDWPVFLDYAAKYLQASAERR